MLGLQSVSRAVIAGLVAGLIGLGHAAAAEDELYRAQTVVTGQGEPNRILGFGACLEDVLIKVSGQPELAGDVRLAPSKAKAKEFVSGFSYHDQFSGKPHRDEQGTRDRPYDLTVEFDHAQIDGLLGQLGLKPWTSHRPVLGVFVAMLHGPKAYIVTSDGTQSDLEREAAMAAAAKRGMQIVLPASAALTSAGLTEARLMSVPVTELAPIAAAQSGEAVLVGHLTWSDDDLGWMTRWQMTWHGKDFAWQFHGVSFDEAFRRGIGGAAQVLSGNGNPDNWNHSR